MAAVAATDSVPGRSDAPGFKDFVELVVSSPANPAVLFESEPSKWK